MHMQNHPHQPSWQQPTMPYAVTHLPPPHQHLQPPPGGDPFARLAWLEKQHQALFNDNALQFNNNLRLNDANTRLVQENEQLRKQNASLLAELNAAASAAARPSMETVQLRDAHGLLLAENKRLMEEKEKIANENREIRARQLAGNSERQKALIQEQKDKIATMAQTISAQTVREASLNSQLTSLKNKAKDDSGIYIECENCRDSYGIRDTLCAACFMPAYEWDARTRKGSTKVKHHGFDAYGDIGIVTDVSDSEDEGRSYDQSYYHEDRDPYHDTRLKEDLFEWLQVWCLQNSSRIERQRVLERNNNSPTIRKLVEDLRDIEREIRKSYKTLAEHKKKKRQMKRKLIVLADETPVVTNDETILKKKLYTFCRIMAMPLRGFECSRFPKFDDKMLRERDAVK